MCVYLFVCVLCQASYLLSTLLRPVCFPHPVIKSVHRLGDVYTPGLQSYPIFFEEFLSLCCAMMITRCMGDEQVRTLTIPSFSLTISTWSTKYYISCKQAIWLDKRSVTHKQWQIPTSGVEFLRFSDTFSIFVNGFFTPDVSRLAALSWDVNCRVVTLIVLNVLRTKFRSVVIISKIWHWVSAFFRYSVTDSSAKMVNRECISTWYIIK